MVSALKASVVTLCVCDRSMVAASITTVFGVFASKGSTKLGILYLQWQLSYYEITLLNKYMYTHLMEQNIPCIRDSMLSFQEEESINRSKHTTARTHTQISIGKLHICVYNRYYICMYI